MIRRLFNACMCQPQELTASRDDLEVIGVFNPGAALVGDEVVILARVAERPREQRAGYVALPYWKPGEGVVIDWVAHEDVDLLDPRVVQRKRDGLVRLTFISHLRVLRSRDGRSIDSEEPLRFEPQAEYEEFGVEDPRITRIGEKYWITYVAVSRHGAATALASTTDFRTFERHGIIFQIENKDVVLFPEKIGGAFVAIHRPVGGTPFTQPEMWLARSDDMIHWGRHEVMQGGESEWDAGRVGAGAPPIRTDDGWLEIYHGSRKATREGEVGVYSAAAMLLDADEPHRVIRKSSGPIMLPQEDFECGGFVANVVFPTGIVDRGDVLQIYYGAADCATGVVEFSKADVLASTV